MAIGLQGHYTKGPVLLQGGLPLPVANVDQKKMDFPACSNDSRGHEKH